MAALGSSCLVLSLAVCAYGIVAAIYGVRSGRVEFTDSARRAVYALAGILTVAFAVLELAFLRNDFAFNTVADTSSRTTPALYRAAAVWSSQEGPLLRFPTMVIHPPMLYSGYTLCTIPFAFAVGALLTRRIDADWIAATRRFAFAAWLCLGVGI